jgi:hypothetical protein
MAVIGGIEAHQCRKQAPVRLGNLRAGQVTEPPEAILPVERRENRVERVFIG